MIGKIRGRVDYTAKDYVLIDVNGVGYLVYCADYTLARLPNTGGMVALYTDLIVREDNLQLFGFFNRGRASMAQIADDCAGGWGEGGFGDCVRLGGGGCWPRPDPWR